MSVSSYVTVVYVVGKFFANAQKLLDRSVPMAYIAGDGDPVAIAD